MVHSAMVQYLYYCNVLYDLHLRGKFERLENKLLYREGLTSFQGTGVPVRRYAIGNATGMR